MKKLLLAAVCSLSLVGAVAAHAEATHASGGLGFHSTSAPIGVRWWLAGQKVGIDAGIGFASEPSGVTDDKVSSYTLDVGVPFVIKSWEGVHLLFRPGLNYNSQQIPFDSDPIAPGYQFDTENQTSFAVLGEFEAEVFLKDNLSVSASHGIRFSSVNPAGPGDSVTSFSTFGNNFTEVGFHVYFLGGE